MADEHLWKRSSYSDQQGGSCIEIAELTNQIGIRDSKDKAGPALLVSAASWTSFIGLVQSASSGQGRIK